jgi:hypothetical protein
MFSFASFTVPRINLDIAYVTNVCLSKPHSCFMKNSKPTFTSALLVFYGENFEDTFCEDNLVSSYLALTFSSDTTLLQLYSILVTAVLTVMQKGLTKLHAVTALSMVASPVTIYILVYSLRNVFGSQTRLDSLIGKGKIAQKALVMAGMVSSCKVNPRNWKMTVVFS